ncbi:MAG: peroxiredoxin [Bdellovibrionia bacterium]
MSIGSMHPGNSRLTRTLVLGLALLGLALKPGDQAPEFTALNQNETPVTLSSFRGSPVILFFYPKDQTPGCTQEACHFRDEYLKFKKKGAVILGVSVQDSKEHQKFREKHRLPFDLLVDSQGSVADQFGVGRIPLLGLLQRKTVLISAEGKIVRVYESVNPETHAQEVLKDLESLSPKK